MQQKGSDEEDVHSVVRILYDGYIYSIQRAGGINRYFANIIERLPDDFVPILLTCERNEVNFPSHPDLKTIYYKRYGFRPGRISYWLEPHFFRTASAISTPDIYHPTYYSLLTRQELSRYNRPVIISVWDMVHELYPELLAHDEQVANMKQMSIAAADAIICISENTKKDLIERYAVPENKITVTYLASSIDSSMAYGSEEVPHEPYFLFVGSRITYKNFDGFLAAIAKVISVGREIKICVVGPPFDAAEEKLIADLKLSDKVRHFGYASDTHLAKLYRCSIALVYPSHYEGFGIPPLEAMACGTVVVACNASSIPEVVGDAGLLFNPNAPSELADMLLQLHDDSSLRERLIAAGKRRAQHFSWDRTAAQTVAVYRSVK